MRNYTAQLFSGMDFVNKEKSGKDPDKYAILYDEFDIKIIYPNSYIFENYLVNFMYNNLFPFSESDDPYEGYLMLLCRFLLIKFYLAGIWKNTGEMSKEEIIKFIQIFARDLEHHKNLMINLLADLEEKRYTEVNFIEKFL